MAGVRVQDRKPDTSLAGLRRTSTLNGHRMEVKWARNEQDLPACQLLFVSRSVAKRYDKTLDAVRDSIILDAVT
jgi:hypothetical protein